MYFLTLCLGKTCKCCGSGVSWRLMSTTEHFWLNWQGQETELWARQRDSEWASGAWALRRMTPVKSITITCHYSILLFPHNDDGKTHNVLNRFLGLKSRPCHPIGPFLFKLFLCYICYRLKKLYYSQCMWIPAMFNCNLTYSLSFTLHLGEWQSRFGGGSCPHRFLWISLNHQVLSING